MSKAKKRKHPLPRRARKQGRNKEAGQQLNWRDHAIILGFPLLILTLMTSFMVLLSMRQHSQKIEARVSKWRAKYDLSESQTTQLLEFERNFHGNGNPLSFRNQPITQEIEKHRRDVDKLLGTEVQAH